MHEANIEAHVAEFYDAWNRGDRDRVTQAIASNAIDHDSETGESGSASLLNALTATRVAFPDLQYTVHELAIDSRRQISVANVTCEGTHERDYFEIPATLRHVRWREMRMARWRDGRVVEHWTVSELRESLLQR